MFWGFVCELFNVCVCSMCLCVRVCVLFGMYCVMMYGLVCFCVCVVHLMCVRVVSVEYCVMLHGVLFVV